ncbi:MAG: protein kinase, partial [Gemmataceae bacterium]
MRPSPPGYLIERELARGGMGVVFLAHQVGLNRPVAIKMLLADRHATTDDLTRFELEIHAVARLQHPNIVRIFDVGWYDGLPFCALEYLPGQSLAARLHGQPVAPRRAAELLAVLARAVHAAHESGIVHRDLKPANVLFATDADPWRPEDARLTDFGIAKLADIGPVTATDSVLGTPAYMAPEQAGGRSREVTSRSDVYSLGAILYEVITGRPPFTGTDALEVLPQVLNDEPVRPSRLAPGLPRDLETICLRCLHKDPTRRYASAADLAADLDRFLDGRPVAARPVGTAEVAARWCRRNPVVAALGAALGLAVAIGLGGVGWQWREAVRAGVAREQQAGQAIEARALAERHLTISRVAQAALLWEQSDIPATLKLLEQCPPSHRGWEWYHLRGLCRAHLGGVELPAWGWTVAVHPDGRSAAVVCGWPSGGSQERTVIRCRLPGLVPGPESAGGHVHPVRLAYTPRGRLATLDGAGTARHLDPETMAVIWQQPAPKGTHGAWMSSDGRWIARATTDHRLWLYDADAGRLGPVLAGHPRPIHQVVFSADGRTAASSDAGEELRGWDLEAGRQMFRREGGGTWPRFAPDGQRLAVTVRASELHLLEARTGAVLWRTGGGRHLAYDLAGQPIFSPDGRWVAVNSTGQAPRVWDVATGRGGHPLRGHEGVAYAVRSIQFSPDGRYVATTGSDRTVRLWDPASGDPMALYRGHVAPVEHAAFSPDGRQLLTVSGGPAANSLITWDLSRGQKAWRERRFTRFFARAEYSSLLAFRPNGALVAGYAPFGLASWDESGTRIEDWPLNAAQNRWIEWHAMALSSGGRYAAVRRGADDEVVHFDLETHERRQWAVGEPVRTVAVSPDGRHVAAGTRVGQILVWDAVAGRVVTSVDVGPILRLAFSPDGQTIAVGGFGVSLVDVTHGTIHRLHSGAEEGAVVGLAFDPNGHRLATTVERPGEVRVYDLKEGQLERRWPEPRTLGDVAYHPSGERIAVASREGMVTIYDPRTGLEVLTLRGLTGRQMDLAYPPRVAFSPDGQRLACNDHATGLWVWD